MQIVVALYVAPTALRILYQLLSWAYGPGYYVIAPLALIAVYLGVQSQKTQIPFGNDNKKSKNADNQDYTLM